MEIAGGCSGPQRHCRSCGYDNKGSFAGRVGPLVQYNLSQPVLPDVKVSRAHIFAGNTNSLQAGKVTDVPALEGGILDTTSSTDAYCYPCAKIMQSGREPFTPKQIEEFFREIDYGFFGDLTQLREEGLFDSILECDHCTRNIADLASKP